MNAPSPQELRALLRLRAMREEAAQALLARRRDEMAACQRIVDERVAQITRARRARHALMDWLSSHGAAAAPRVEAFAGARREALDDELERAAADLIDERNDLRDATQQFEEARLAWLREHGRHLAVARLDEELQRARARAAEERIEREAEPRRPLEI